MMSHSSFNSSYQFADTLCYTASITPMARSLSKSYPAVRPMSYPRKGVRRSYGWTNESDAELTLKGKRQTSSFISNSYSNLNYIDYDSDDSDSDYDSDSNSTLNNETIPSPSVSEATNYSSTICSTDTSVKHCLSPRQRMVSFSDEVDIIKPPMIIDNKKNIIKKALKIMKMKKKEAKKDIL